MPRSKWAIAHAKELAEKNRLWRLAHPGYAKQKWEKYSAEKKEELRAKGRAYYEANREKRKAIAVAFTRKRKLRVIEAYGGQCNCCGETRIEFLTIDHINGGGKKHVASVCSSRGSTFYYWLEQQGYPKDEFQLLCFNCNQSKGLFGVCPHVSEPAYGLSEC